MTSHTRPHTCLIIGIGGMGQAWLHKFLPAYKSRLKVSAICDINPSLLEAEGNRLNIPPGMRFGSLEEAIATAEVDFCIIVIPQEHHCRAIVNASQRNLPILTEKPLSNNFDEVAVIADTIRSTGVKFQVVQNYRYNARMLTYRDILRSKVLGQIQYVVSRFRQDYRVYGSWGGGNQGSDFRHKMQNPMVADGSIHHLDMIRNLTGGNCRTISGIGYNPSWSSFAGLSAGLYIAEMDNDTRACYEANLNATGNQDKWHEEHYRTECEHGSVSVSSEGTIRLCRVGEQDEIVPVPNNSPPGHVAIIGQFLDWLEGGEPPECTLEDNLQSTAMMFAAIEAGQQHTSVSVKDFLV